MANVIEPAKLDNLMMVHAYKGSNSLFLHGFLQVAEDKRHFEHKDKPYGLSPSGTSWGDTPWEDAYQLPGSRHLGIAKKILEKYPWWQIESHQEWIQTPQDNKYEFFMPYAGGIPGRLRIIYFSPFLPLSHVKNLEKNKKYCATYFNPSDGTEHYLGEISVDESGNWQAPTPPVQRDWILIVSVI